MEDNGNSASMMTYFMATSERMTRNPSINQLNAFVVLQSARPDAGFVWPEHHSVARPHFWGCHTVCLPDSCNVRRGRCPFALQPPRQFPSSSIQVEHCHSTRPRGQRDLRSAACKLSTTLPPECLCTFTTSAPTCLVFNMLGIRTSYQTLRDQPLPLGCLQ